MAEEIKLTNEEIKNLKTLQEEYNKKIFEFGRLKQAKIELDKQVKELLQEEEKLEKEYEKLQENEEKLAETLENKYGKGTVDLETGQFTKT